MAGPQYALVLMSKG